MRLSTAIVRATSFRAAWAAWQLNFPADERRRRRSRHVQHRHVARGLDRGLAAGRHAEAMAGSEGVATGSVHFSQNASAVQR
eukprot:2074844-Alexandrium_andersonii.AAC.1